MRAAMAVVGMSIPGIGIAIATNIIPGAAIVIAMNTIPGIGIVTAVKVATTGTAATTDTAPAICPMGMADRLMGIGAASSWRGDRLSAGAEGASASSHVEAPNAPTQVGGSSVCRLSNVATGG